MEIGQFNNIVWCDLEIIVLKIHSHSSWNTKMVNTIDHMPNQYKPIVNIYICHENDVIFDNPKTYRENTMHQGSYRGHHFGVSARLKFIDDSNIALFHPDPGKIIWCFVIKYVLTVYANKMNMLHIKGGAVAYKGKSFLILGRGGSGKTEVIKALCNNGATFMANTHLLINGGSVCGVKSNIRIRENDSDVYVSVNQQLNYNVYDGWLPIGGVFWVKYRTDGITLIENIPSNYAIPNLQWFTESIGNWEMKEDLADCYNSDPYEFAEQINKINTMLNDLCEKNDIYYLNLDIFSKEGMERTISTMEKCLNRSCQLTGDI